MCVYLFLVYVNWCACVCVCVLVWYFFWLISHYSVCGWLVIYPRKSKDQTLPIGSRESFTRIILKTILCLVLDSQGYYKFAQVHVPDFLESSSQDLNGGNSMVIADAKWHPKAVQQFDFGRWWGGNAVSLVVGNLLFGLCLVISKWAMDDHFRIFPLPKWRATKTATRWGLVRTRGSFLAT